MDSHSAITAYFPDRPPTWMEVGIGVAILLGTIVPQFLLDPPSVLAVLVGFFAFAVAVGPIANTTLGARIGRWFRGIGIAGRAVVILLFVVVTIGTFALEGVPNDLVTDAGLGGLLACMLYILVYVLLAGEVSGWWPTEADQ